MLTALEFYDAFQEAGFLSPCAWTPAGQGTPALVDVLMQDGVPLLQDGLPLVQASGGTMSPGASTGGWVRFRRTTSEWAAEAGVIDFAPSATWPKGQFAGAAADDTLVINHQGVTHTFRIKEVHVITDGEEIRAELGAL